MRSQQVAPPLLRVFWVVPSYGIVTVYWRDSGRILRAIVKAPGAAGWDCISLGEVMLRLDPGEDRIHTARAFRVSEGGGEYNVARGLRRCFGLRTAIATALADNAVGRLVEDLMLQGGVDLELVRWAPFDGVGRAVRNGLNFTERGFGVRAAAGLFRPRKYGSLAD